MVKQTLFSFLMIALAFLLASCKLDGPTEEEMYTWIVTSNIDGSDLQYVCKTSETAYFVPDPNDPDGECILIDGGAKIDLINLDGTDRRTIISSVGSVYSFSRDRTKMLLNPDGEIYIANTDGSDLQNLTNTPDIWEGYPSFAADDEEIVFVMYSTYQRDAYLAVLDLSNDECCIVHQESSGSEQAFMFFDNPVFTDDDTIVFTRSYRENNSEAQSPDLRQITIDDSLVNILISDKPVYDFYYDIANHRALVKTGTFAELVDLTDLSIQGTYENVYPYNNFPFSFSGNKISLGQVVYNLLDNQEYQVDSDENDFNCDETRIVGHVLGHYSEE